MGLLGMSGNLLDFWFMARTVLIFKYEDEENGEPIGPAHVVKFDPPSPPVDVEDFDHWMTQTEAEKVAQERGYEFMED